MTATATMCARCSELLPAEALTPCPGTGEALCQFCRPSEQEVVWAQSDVRQALSILGPAGVLREAQGWCRGQCGPSWTARERLLAALAATLGELLPLAEELDQ